MVSQVVACTVVPCPPHAEGVGPGGGGGGGGEGFQSQSAVRKGGVSLKKNLAKAG